ncbi:alpha-1,2-galactosyltransferase Gmh1 [Schizosaccharomyces cryophilus OY26]|uniref:Alpha-1,2-galactosyltransferase Gmh1 n=1 Tax=Schizosaccharomyces cryophilus (strain OY26 / ATCC MYA-4695 / CBS 11777 / NBRC 106824 / NRRL Y48691) TaxID=653667 RepID=S9VVE4_SCHCR|nr:alpha-1,2-galactosyltransferase Gmh1 [Schizosaccharomyces cryophilus OY26]EPY50139.1 alpha-1,2-galactosyltransferase Gmh1 [Schizosaccharomyces cryophilus OY26]
MVSGVWLSKKLLCIVIAAVFTGVLLFVNNLHKVNLSLLNFPSFTPNDSSCVPFSCTPPRPRIAPADEKSYGQATTLHKAFINESDTQEPKSHEIILLLGSNGNMGSFDPSIMDDVLANRLEYVKKHNYNFEFVNLTGINVPTVWGKMPSVIQMMEKYPNAKWIWWLDQDALIMNKDQSLQNLFLSPENLKSSLMTDQPLWSQIIKEDKRRTPSSYNDEMIDNVEFLISEDHNGVNAGSFLVKNTETMALFMDLLTEPTLVEHKIVRHEQDLIGLMIHRHPQLAAKFGILPQRYLNAYPHAPPEMEYQPGDLLVHFAGCWVENKCTTLWEEFKQKLD